MLSNVLGFREIEYDIGQEQELASILNVSLLSLKHDAWHVVLRKILRLHLD